MSEVATIVKSLCWRVEDQIEARKRAQMTKKIPRHSLSVLRLDIITTIPDQRLRNCIDYLPHHDHQPSLVISEPHTSIKIPWRIRIPHVYNEIIRQVTRSIRRHMLPLEIVLIIMLQFDCCYLPFWTLHKVIVLVAFQVYEGLLNPLDYVCFALIAILAA